jgi:hypothetical protein
VVTAASDTNRQNMWRRCHVAPAGNSNISSIAECEGPTMGVCTWNSHLSHEDKGSPRMLKRLPLHAHTHTAHALALSCMRWHSPMLLRRGKQVPM